LRVVLLPVVLRSIDVMKLYGGLLSPYVMRVVLAARAKSMDLPVLQPENGLKSSEFLALNPMGKMPTLIDGDFALPESEIIVQYLEDAHPRPSILPADPKTRARARLITRLIDVYISPLLGPLFQGKGADLNALGAALGYIEHYLDSGHSHAVGAEFSIADCALLPTLFFMDALNASAGTAAFVAKNPKLNAYWERAKMSEVGLWMTHEMSTALTAFLKQRAAQAAAS
jgi:glutathione S-transferase